MVIVAFRTGCAKVVFGVADGYCVLAEPSCWVVDRSSKKVRTCRHGKYSAFNAIGEKQQQGNILYVMPDGRERQRQWLTAQQAKWEYLGEALNLSGRFDGS